MSNMNVFSTYMQLIAVLECLKLVRQNNRLLQSFLLQWLPKTYINIIVACSYKQTIIVLMFCLTNWLT